MGPGEANHLVTLQTHIHQHFFGAGQGWPTFLRARAKIADNFRRKRELTGTVFESRVGTRVAARLARPFSRSCF